MKKQTFNEGLLNFLEASPTPYHAVQSLTTALEQAGFEELPENETWINDDGSPSLQGRFYVKRNDSSLIAFTTGDDPEALSNTGFRMVGAHTDSPCLKLKPNPDIEKEGYGQLGLEVYGGALLNPWFDRDLSIAGRVNYMASNDTIKSILVDFHKPIAIIPSLAIHLDREANKNRTVNAQTDMPPIFLQNSNGKTSNLKHLITKQLQKNSNLDIVKLLDFDLSLYDTQPPAIIGLNDEFITSARLDNLLSCYIGLMALLDSDGLTPSVLVCYDHEEVGSRSSHGANSAFLTSILKRLFSSDDELAQCLNRSVFISCDNAHGVHPNYPTKHDKTHGPILNQGPVIKYHANQSYATSSETAALFRWLCGQCSVKPQTFASRADLRCGGTIGPMTAANLGIRTLDVGVPQFAMHSIRETAGSSDAHSLFKVLRQFFDLEALPFEE